jgi:hypothetical protein
MVGQVGCLCGSDMTLAASGLVLTLRTATALRTGWINCTFFRAWSASSGRMAAHVQRRVIGMLMT